MSIIMSPLRFCSDCCKSCLPASARSQEVRVKWKVTVEPVVFLYMMPTFMLLPVLQDLVYTKVCYSMYDWNVCSHLNESYNSDALSKVQYNSAHWIQASTILMCLPSMVSGQLLGTYSDARSRKLPLMVPPAGAVFASLVYVMISGTFVDLDISWILLASFLTGLGGGYAACLNTCATYLSEVSGQVSRTSRVGVMECMSLIGACLGPLLAGFLQTYYSRDIVFSLILAFHAINVLYIFGFVQNVNSSGSVSRLSQSERVHSLHNDRSFLYRVWHRVKEMFGVVCRARHENRKTYLLLLVFAAAIYMFVVTGQADVMYFYLKDEPVSWSLVQYSEFMALSSALAFFSLLLIMVPLSFKLDDCVLLMIGVASKFISLVLLGLAKTNSLVYVVAVVGCAYSWCLPAIRSTLSKLILPNELGRVFGLFGIVENACTLLGTSVFSSIYPITRGNEHTRGIVWFSAAAVLIVPFVIAAVLIKPIRKLQSYSAMDVDEDDFEGEHTSSSIPGVSTTDVLQADNEDDEHVVVGITNSDAARSLGSPVAENSHRSISISSTSTMSSSATPITPISPSSLASGILSTQYPGVADTDLSAALVDVKSPANETIGTSVSADDLSSTVQDERFGAKHSNVLSQSDPQTATGNEER